MWNQNKNKNEYASIPVIINHEPQDHHHDTNNQVYNNSGGYGGKTIALLLIVMAMVLVAANPTFHRRNVPAMNNVSSELGSKDDSPHMVAEAATMGLSSKSSSSTSSSTAMEAASLSTTTTTTLSPLSDDGIDELRWSNAPESYDATDHGKLTFTVPGKTDYWRITYHGFIKDDGPFYFMPITSEKFKVTAQFSGNYETLFDQAGIMVRESDTVWMKCGVEFTDGMQHASTVMTRDYSDWSIVPIHSNPDTIWFQVKRTQECMETFYSLDGITFTQLRQAYLTTAPTLEVGLVAASPRGEGFDVTFDSWEVELLD